MRVSARVRANRANAKKSTGPRTQQGRARASRNAVKHGLSIPPSLWQRPAHEVEKITQRIAGEGASAQILEAATAIAEAELDLMRIRRVKCDLMSDPKAREKKLSRKEIAAVGRKFREEKKRIDALEKSRRLSEWDAFDEACELVACVDCALEPKPRSLEQGMGLLATHIARIGRYERRVLTRRRRAIEAFDALVEEERETRISGAVQATAT